MLSVIIIDFFSAKRTIKFIADFLMYCNYKLNSFVIIDNSCNLENFNNIIQEIENHFFIISKNIKEEFINFKVNDGTLICCISNKENVGFAKGNNIGYKYAKNFFHPDFILFSNNDIQFKDNKFNMNDMIEIFSNKSKIGLIGPKVIGLDGKYQSPCKRMDISKRWWIKQLLFPLHKINKITKYIDKDVIDNCKSGYVYRIIGAFMLFNKNAFEDIGGFDENTFLYAEEPIIAERLLKKEYNTYFMSELEIIHEEGGTTKETDFLKNKIKKESRVFTSEMYYYEKYRGTNRMIIGLTKCIFQVYILKLKLIGIFIKKESK